MHSNNYLIVKYIYRGVFGRFGIQISIISVNDVALRSCRLKALELPDCVKARHFAHFLAVCTAGVAPRSKPK
jgi:hypothetical protein